MSNLLSGSGAFKHKRAPRSSILRSLYDREINGAKARMNILKTTCQTVYPNCSVVKVRAPTRNLRKFSPDGRCFIAFSEDLKWIEIYDYLGCSMAADLLKNYQTNFICRNFSNFHNHNVVCDKIFSKLFQLKYRLQGEPGELMERNCSLFTENSLYALAASSSESYGPLGDILELYANNDVVGPIGDFTLRNYTIYLVDLRIGAVCDVINFPLDVIILNYNQDINLLNYTLAILSVQHQLISIYDISDDCFKMVRTIGQHCHILDNFLYTTVFPSDTSFRENGINGLKHKLLVFIFKKADSETKRLGQPAPLNYFYKNFDRFLQLRMWKMQLLDENHLLIRYSTEDVVNMTTRSNPNEEVSFFMIYNMTTTTVLDVYENYADRLVNVFENYCDYFRNSFKNPEGFKPCSIANNTYLWSSYKNSKEHAFKTDESKIKICKEVLAELPTPCQFFSSSPYLNKSLFMYDDRSISPAEVSKKNVPCPIRFASRETRLEKFRLHFLSHNNKNRNDSVEFTFHPTEPFAISTVYDGPLISINFHMHKVYMPE